ncbi:hypothetical protein RFI_13522 [Reticulomyxa filosa]|uniref:Uncharacterized protein n=1 Tax=Reticulomyxa filosa TaxID=46433 RepID=X6NE80_RETFI|nr:hypothetical protein RFI_13522 [Reticulomyxa filosa]|eukprot:ETO23657.1 hypothetical protein RFI_13522 [Reticulomyxa filosa]
MDKLECEGPFERPGMPTEENIAEFVKMYREDSNDQKKGNQSNPSSSSSASASGSLASNVPNKNGKMNTSNSSESTSATSNATKNTHLDRQKPVLPALQMILSNRSMDNSGDEATTATEQQASNA